MERFVFITAIVVAGIYALVMMVSSSGGWSFHFEDGERGPAALVAVAPDALPEQSYPARALRIRHSAAHVSITPEDRDDFIISIENPGVAPMPTIVVDGDRLVVDGQLRGRIIRCATDGGAELRGYEAVTPETQPRIVIRAPRRLEADFAGANTVEIGATERLEVNHRGCGTTAAGDVAETLDVDLAGSGEVRAGAVRSLDADVAGSGQVHVAAVAERADISLAGSGGATIGSLTGALDMSGAGSGSVAVEGGALSLADISLAGSGGVRIAAPVQRLDVSIVGSGGVHVAGDVGDLDVEIAGSGDVSAFAVTGERRQRVAGSGSVRVGR